MATPRTFKITSPRMRGNDVEHWQGEIKVEFDRMDIDCPIHIDGVYGEVTRSFTRSLCYALGMDVDQVMRHGTTPELRTKIRHRKLTPEEQTRMDQRVDWRRRLRERYEHMDGPNVARLVQRMITDDNNYQPGHDGIDVITFPDVPVFAPVRAEIFDVRKAGWWRLGAPKDPELLSKGDGIVQMKILETVGPFIKGRHIGLGHAEKALVKIGDVVKAGDRVAHSGFANAWHIHLMYNDGLTTKGVGNIDPQKILDYCMKFG